jgi:eukaryotic-like serine/threonine-protein kinase
VTRDRDGDLERICHDALERPLAERADFLVEACGGDEGLRREAEELLSQDEAAASFLATPALAMVARAFCAAGPALAAGQQVGPYTIVCRLGAGGMGEVYRARDPTLGRDVAIKVLPALFTDDPERLRRFEREAQVLASLNHPNIATIHGVERVDGITALVLEVVEGETLAERLQSDNVSSFGRPSRDGEEGRTPHTSLPLSEALTIARQIAEAIEAAHEKGIVHRDLKPANIRIRPDGVVKVLDFGLSKAAVGEAATAAISPSATQEDGVTCAGMILGTPTYMSPEQARGEVVDKRTDIWAFGCVLYEMLAGRMAFDAPSISDTLNAVLKTDPDWNRLPAATPASVRRLLERCLDKDLRRRLQHVGDARIEIEDVLSPASFGSAATATGVQPRSSVPLRSIATIASLVALAAVGVFLLNAWMAPQRQTAERMSRTSIASTGRAAVFHYSQLAITPDGTRVVYVGNKGTQLFVQRLDQLDPTPVATGIPSSVFLSPDGQWVGFSDRDMMKKVAWTGGPATTILSVVRGTLDGATWAPDDTIIFAGQDPTTGLQRVSAAGGGVTVLTRPEPKKGELDHIRPEMLPGGGAVLFTITATAGGADAAQVAVLDLAKGGYKVLVRGGSYARYVPSGHLLYAAGGALRAIAFDVDRLETRGTAAIVEPRVGSQQGFSAFDVAANGTLVYMDAPAQPSPQLLVWVDRQGREEPLGVPPRPYDQPRVSPDGTKVAVVTVGDISVWDLARRRFNPLTSDPAPQFAPVWMRDSRRLFFFWRTGGPTSVFRQIADGIGAAEPISTGLEGNLQPSGLTPDGARVLLTLANKDLMVMTLDGTSHAEGLLQTEFNERNGVVSPNGRWLAYESDRSGRSEIYVAPFPDVRGALSAITAIGGTQPLWAPNGQELFYVAPDGSLMGVRVELRGGTWSAGSPATVLAALYATGAALGPRSYDVSRDGQRFLMVKEAKPAAASQIIVAQHWIDELKRLVPVN